MLYRAARIDVCVSIVGFSKLVLILTDRKVEIINFRQQGYFLLKKLGILKEVLLGKWR